MKFRAIVFALVAALLVPIVKDALAQKPSRPFSVVVAQWNRILDNAETYVKGVTYSSERSREFRQRIGRVREEALAAAAAANREIEAQRALIEALGPAPAEGDPPEKPVIAQQRAGYEAEIVFYRARVSQAEVALTRATSLEAAISDLSRARLLSRLGQANPLPLAPDTVAVALPELWQALRDIAATPARWWDALAPENRAPSKFMRFALFLAVAFFLGWIVRALSIRYFGRDPAINDPTYARCLLGAVAEGVSRGIFPAVILATVLFRITSEQTLVTGPFAEVLAAFCEALILFVLAWALARAVLAPDLPNWRLTVLTPDGARKLSYRITALAAVSATNVFLFGSMEGMSIAANTSAKFTAFYAFVIQTLEAIGMLVILQPRLWRVDAEAARKREQESDGTVSAPTVCNRFWLGVHVIFAIVAVLAIVANVLGYGQLGAYLINNLINTAMAGGGLYLLRGLLRESIALALRLEIVRHNLAIQHRSRQLIKFWLRALLDVAVSVSGLFLIAPFWGVPADDLSLWATTTLGGFTVGNVTISLIDIAIGVVVFFVVMLLFRAMQRALSERILPETEIDVGLQHSLTAGFGYIGFILAAMLGIAALGLDLTNIALIAGALSVGIGFGLQTIVSNFVAGLTLLVERPIKVGDWIVVGDQEGIVKRIQVRATEIETFQRNSVIVPNSAFLQNNVINRTHKDSVGRIELAVGVAYGSDTTKVKQILLDVAAENSKVAEWPEPFVLFQNFGESSLDFELRCYCQNVFDTIRGASELRFAVDDAFRREGIEIPFPQRDVNLKGVDMLSPPDKIAAPE